MACAEECKGEDATVRKHFVSARASGAVQEHADEAQQVAEQFDDASQRLPEVPEEVADSIHVAPVPQKAPDGNLS